MDKKILKHMIRYEVGGSFELIENRTRRIDNGKFLRENNEVFSFKGKRINYQTTDFIFLKELTEKMTKKHKNFLYAFEIIKTRYGSKDNKFGFIIKNGSEYILFYGTEIEDLISLYYQSDTSLNFNEVTFYTDDKCNVIKVDNDYFNTKNMDHFKSKFYYEIFKNDYLDYYLDKYNLKIRKLVANIFN